MTSKVGACIIFIFMFYQFSTGQNLGNVQSSISTSSLGIPFSITLPEVENILNKGVPIKLYVDTSYLNNNNDQLKIFVKKNGKVKIKPFSSTQLKLEVPLYIIADKGYGTLGYYTYKSCHFEIVLKYKISFGMQPNWKIKTVTTPNGYDWIAKPVLEYGVVKVPIAPIVELIIKKQQQSITSSIDKSAQENLNFTDTGFSIWQTLSQPMLISEEYETWMKLTPTKASMKPLKIVNNAITSTFGLEFQAKSIIGTKPDSVIPTKSLPNLVMMQSINENFNVITKAQISYGFISKMANQMLANQKLEFLNGNYHIMLSNIDIIGSDQNLLIRANMSGSTNGQIKILGQPIYDSLQKRIVLQHVEMALETKSIFQKSASWLLNGTLESLIQKKFYIPTDSLESSLHSNLKVALNKEYINGYKFQGNINHLKPTTFYNSNDGLIVELLTTGQLKLKIDGL